MATSSILGGTPAPEQSKGRGTDALGPSDSSDSGSDVLGERQMSTGQDDPDEMGATPADTRSDTDRFGTGERASATPSGEHDAADILPDRVSRDPSPDDIDASIDVEDLPSGDDPSAGPDPEHADDEQE
ncbi:hypothetical protein [Roseateles sp. MS654]|uniref:hypothetical protein n=1 Tax=Roseateles sp. MS654 TaxID=3412685 RepID=UPI003C2C0009